MVARVVVDIKHEEINQVFDYIVPKDLESQIQKGMRVLVPFNTLKRLGYVIDLLQTSELATKEITELLDTYRVIDDESFMLADFLLKTPRSLLATVYQTVIPNELLLHYSKRVELLKKDYEDTTITSLFNQRGFYYPSKKELESMSRLNYLHQKGIVKIETIIKPKVSKKQEVVIKVQDLDVKLTPKQQYLVDYVLSQGKVLKKNLVDYGSSAMIKTLIQKGVFLEEFLDKQIEKVVYEDHAKISLNQEEGSIYEMLQASKSIKPWVFNNYKASHQNLHLKLFEDVLKEGNQILYIVSEIDDVEPTAKRLQQVFKTTPIVTLHSDLTPKQRLSSYKQFMNHEALILIGTRKASFIQASKLGLIFMDDSSNTSSYIQEDQVYYDTKEILKLRAKYHRIPLILASLTQDAQALYDAQKRHIEFVDFKDVKTTNLIKINMGEELKKGNTSIISNELKVALDEALKKHKKAVLIMNQKGYAPFVLCRSCGYVPKDPETQIPLTYYESLNELKSNYRNYQEPFTHTCKNCGKPTVKPVGFGVEFIRQQLKKMYPNESIVQIDKSTLKDAKTRATTLEKLEQSHIIVGTELALKHVDHQVNVIGVLMADQFLLIPSFDAYEKAYRILYTMMNMNVKQVFVQTYNPNHQVFKYLLNQDQEAFYKEVLNNRKLLGLPPYNHVAQILLEGKSYLKTFQDAYYIKSFVARYGVSALGPVSSHIFKLNDLYRVILTLKYQELDSDIIDYLNSYQNPDIKLSYYPAIKWN